LSTDGSLNIEPEKPGDVAPGPRHLRCSVFLAARERSADRERAPSIVARALKGGLGQIALLFRVIIAVASLSKCETGLTGLNCLELHTENACRPSFPNAYESLFAVFSDSGPTQGPLPAGSDSRPLGRHGAIMQTIAGARRVRLYRIYAPDLPKLRESRIFPDELRGPISMSP